MKLNLGAGRNIREGFVNVDWVDGPGIDLVANLDHPTKVELPWADDSVTEMWLSHVIEHLHHPLPLFAELWRVAVPGCLITVRCPYGSSDDADEDPTHVRRMFAGSWLYFSAPAYWKADYNYRGDWQPERLVLRTKPEVHHLNDMELRHAITFSRNTIGEMECVLRAVKPARPPDGALQQNPTVAFEPEPQP